MGKGSSKGHTPREAKDNLKSTQLLSVIDAISEGPVEGPVDGLKSVLLNSTPVLDTEGNTNISGSVNANSGTLNNVTINENCQIKGKLSANQIEGDIVKTVSKSFPRTNSYASGTITVRISDDQKFDRQVMIPPVLFRGGKHENFNSNNQQSYWYSTCRLRVTRNGQEIFNQ
ncbi:phage tail tip protein, partial [Escherichia coli]